MDHRSASSQVAPPTSKPGQDETRLHGHWLLLARSVWFALVILTLSVCIASLPEYVMQLQTVCRLAACSYGQLSPGTVATLQHFGLTVGSYTTFMFVLATLVALAFFGTAGFQPKEGEGVSRLQEHRQGLSPKLLLSLHPLGRNSYQAARVFHQNAKPQVEAVAIAIGLSHESSAC